MSKTQPTIIDTTAQTPPGYDTTFRVSYDPAVIVPMAVSKGVPMAAIAPRVVVADKPTTAADKALAHMRQVLNMPGLTLYPTKIVKRGIVVEAK